MTENPIEKAMFLRKYLYESVLMALAAAVIALSGMYNSLNNYIRTEQYKQNIESVRAIDRNTDALNTLIIMSRQNQNNNK
jgi:hypothetical protein